MLDDFGQFADEVINGLTEDGSLTTGEFAWAEPVPFSDAHTPAFPIDALPSPLDILTEALSDSTQTPTEMSGLLALGVLATAFQNGFMVEVTPDWTEPLCLYTVVVAPPGERKSAVLSTLTKPIFEFECQQREFEAAELAQNQAERDMLEKRMETAKNMAAKGKDNSEAARVEALELAGRLAEFKELHEFRLLADDVTPEKLADMMSNQGGCITMVSSEGGLFDGLTGRYDNKGGLDIYLKAHAGDPILIDRLGRKGNALRTPRLTIMMTVQPDVLQGLMANATFRGRGLCGRFLYAICHSKIGARKVSPPPIPSEVKTAYRDFVRRILSNREHGTILLSPEADHIRQDFQADVENKLGLDWESMRDWGGKLTGAMVRIAALLHCATAQGNPADTPISAATMEAAEKIADFLGHHAESAYQQMGSDPVQADAKYILRRLTGKSEITKRDLFVLCRGRFRRAEAMTPALTLLTEMNYIREEQQLTGGRPSSKIAVNPLAQNAQKTQKPLL